MAESKVRFILVAPQHPGNVGAVARAMKNMGLTDLAIVSPAAWDPEQARWNAPGCDDLLAQLRICGTLEEALEGVSHVVGTTARHRRGGQAVIDPATLGGRVHDEPGRTAVLFGREDHGLSEVELERCESLLRIPTAEHASLNLAQAALLTAWAVFEAGRARGVRFAGRKLGGTPGAESTTAVLDQPDRRGRPADVGVMEPVVGQISELLGRVGYLRGIDPRRVERTFRRLLQRAGATVREVDAIRGMVKRVGWALESPGTDWRATRHGRD